MATFEFVENLRPDAAKTVATLQSQGLNVYMLSGDTQTSAQGVAEQLGISNEKNNVMGDCTPETKLALMKALQAQGRDIVSLMRGEPDFPTPPHITASRRQGAGRQAYHLPRQSWRDEVSRSGSGETATQQRRYL